MTKSYDDDPDIQDHTRRSITPVAPVAEPEITITFKLQELRGLIAAAAIGAKRLAKSEFTEQVYATCVRVSKQTGRFDAVGRERK